LSTIYYSALANYKGTMSVDEFSTLLGPDLSEQLRHNEPSLFASEGQPPEELTLEVLECSYEYARQMVETHAMETMRLSKNEELRRAANAQIVHLRMMDNM